MKPLGVSSDLRQGSSDNSVTNFVPRFPYIFKRETQSSFEDLLLVVLVILIETKIRDQILTTISEQYFRFSI